VVGSGPDGCPGSNPCLGIRDDPVPREAGGPDVGETHDPAVREADDPDVREAGDPDVRKAGDPAEPENHDESGDRGTADSGGCPRSRGYRPSGLRAGMAIALPSGRRSRDGYSVTIP
jgi:hypothetical protein